jgi:hypothetical protein
MSNTTAPRHILHLVVDGFPAERVDELCAPVANSTDVTEVFSLTEESAAAALEKIFAADTIAVWGAI